MEIIAIVWKNFFEIWGKISDDEGKTGGNGLYAFHFA